MRWWLCVSRSGRRRWCGGGSGCTVPHGVAGLPRSRGGFRGVADVGIVAGWHARSGPHLDRLVEESGAAATRLARIHAQGGWVAAISNGVALLGQAGLLTARQAVAPWPFVASILRHSAGVELVTDRAWTVDARLWTCDSPVLATEVALDLLRHTPLAELAASTAPLYLHPQNASKWPRALPRTPMPASCRPARWSARGAGWRSIWPNRTACRPRPQRQPPVPARCCVTSPRPTARAHWIYLHALRVVHARVLLETTYLPVEQVAQACGYQDVGTFRRLFSRLTGERPADYREQHRLRTSRKRWGGQALA